MPAGVALVDGVRAVTRERPPARSRRGAAPAAAIRVRFAGGTGARLDPGSPRDRVWAEVLESLRTSRQPAYVEIDPDTQYITALLLPLRFTVTAIREASPEEDLEVELEISQARHYLRRAHPRFHDLREMLERARRERTPVLVTESLAGSAIIDVRPVPSAGARAPR